MLTSSATISPSTSLSGSSLVAAVTSTASAVAGLQSAIASGTDPSAALAAGRQAIADATRAVAPGATVSGGGGAAAAPGNVVFVGGSTADTDLMIQLSSQDTTAALDPQTALEYGISPAATTGSDAGSTSAGGDTAATSDAKSGASGCGCGGDGEASSGGASGAPAALAASSLGAGALGGASATTTERNESSAKAKPKKSADDDKDAALRKKLLDLARGELGVRESEGLDQDPRIREYRRSVIGKAGDKPAWWCAYFVSWLFNEAGAPVVDKNGDGLSANIGDWGKKTGRFMKPSETPQPGDIILFKNKGGTPRWANHIGIVEKVDANGTIHTIEGNISDKVARAKRRVGKDNIVGFVSATR